MNKDTLAISCPQDEETHLATLSVHAGRMVDEATGSVALPIHMSTNFERGQDEGYPKGFFYSTFGNPNRAWLEEAMVKLEGGSAAIATSSGMAAIACVLSVLAPGDRVLAPKDLFQGSARLLNDQFRQWGVQADFFDPRHPGELESHIRERTRMIWLDTPSNPLLRISDIASVSKVAKAHRCWLAVDSTLATFALQQPLRLGADVVIHAATKFIAGHSDVVNGLAVFREQSQLFKSAESFRANLGAVPSPMDCWLVHRGLTTLWIRIQRQSQTALRIAEWLETRDEVDKVFYPGLQTHESHKIAREQMDGGFGGILAFILKDGSRSATRLVNATKLFTKASSLGGTESLIEHRSTSPIQILGNGTGQQIPPGLIRLSLGLEDADDLTRDLERAFEALGQSQTA